MNQTNPNFHARFAKAQLNQMVEYRSRSGKIKNMKEFIPRLYTLLKYLDEIRPEELAEFSKTDTDVYGNSQENGFDFISVGGYRLYEAPYDIKNTEVDLLEQALIRDGKDVYIDVGCIDIIHVPTNVYRKDYWDNRNKMICDIINDFSIENYMQSH